MEKNVTSQPLFPIFPTDFIDFLAVLNRYAAMICIFIAAALLKRRSADSLPKTRIRKKRMIFPTTDTGLSLALVYFEAVPKCMQQLKKFLIQSAANLLVVTLIGLLGRPVRKSWRVSTCN